MTMTAHYDTCDDADAMTITTADGRSSVVQDCPCPKPESPAVCTPGDTP